MVKVYFNPYHNLALVVSDKTKKYKLVKLNSMKNTNANFYQSTIQRIGEVLKQAQTLNYGRA